MARRHAAHVDQHLGVGAPEAGDDRQQRMDGGFVGADDDAAAAHLLELADGELGVGGEGQQAAGIVLEEAAGLGQRAVARRAVEQAIPELFFEAFDGLADRRLGPVELLCGLGKTSLGRDGRENGEILQLHGVIITTPYRIPKVINWTEGPGRGYKGYVTGGPNEGPPHHLRHHAARRRTGARLLDANRREAEDGAAARVDGRRPHRGRVPDRVRRRRRGRAHGVDAHQGAGDRGAGALQPGRHRAGRVGARAGRAQAHPRLHRDVRPAPRAQAAHVAIALPEGGDGRRPPGAHVYRRRAVLRRGCDAQRSGIPVARRRSRHSVGGEDHQPSRYRRLLDPRRDAVVLLPADQSRPQLRPGGLEHALPRRPRSCGRQYPRGAHRRRAPGRVHHQRDRRARRQCVARGSRHGDAGARRPSAVRERHRHEADLTPPASC